jgi:hypothetical protein
MTAFGEFGMEAADIAEAAVTGSAAEMEGVGATAEVANDITEAAWGVGEAGVGNEHVTRLPIPIGHGHQLVINPEGWKKLLHHPAAVDAITKRAEAIASAANGLAVGRGKDRPLYSVKVQNRTDTTRARALIKPANMAAVRDNQMNQTLLKAADSFPSDPKPDME